MRERWGVIEVATIVVSEVAVTMAEVMIAVIALILGIVV